MAPLVIQAYYKKTAAGNVTYESKLTFSSASENTKFMLAPVDGDKGASDERELTKEELAQQEEAV